MEYQRSALEGLAKIREFLDENEGWRVVVEELMRGYIAFHYQSPSKGLGSWDCDCRIRMVEIWMRNLGRLERIGKLGNLMILAWCWRISGAILNKITNRNPYEKALYD